MAEALGTTKAGIFGATDIFVDQRKYDKDKSNFFIWRERGFAAMINLLITSMKKVTVSDPEPKHFEDGYRPLSIALTTTTIAASSGSAPCTVVITFPTDSTTYPSTAVSNFVVGQEWENDTIYQSDTDVSHTFSLTWSATVYYSREVMLVTAVDYSTGAVTFRRHIGTDTHYPLATPTDVEPLTTHKLLLHSTAITDGAGAPQSFNQNPVVVNNYIQKFREPYEITNIAQKTDIFGENEWQRKARNARRNFTRQLIRAAISGRMYKFADSTGELKWMTGGFQPWMPADATHRYLFTTPPTLPAINSAAEQVFNYGSPEKWAFAGPGAMTKISNNLAPYLRFNEELSKNLGMDVHDLTSAGGGKLHLMQEYELGQTGRNNHVLIMDKPYFMYMYMNGEDIRVNKGPNGTGLQLPDEDKTKNEITGTLGFKRTYKDTHFEWILNA